MFSTFVETIPLMAKKETEFESVKIKTPIVNKVRANKKKTGVPVSTFFEQAAEEKLAFAKIVSNRTGSKVN